MRSWNSEISVSSNTFASDSICCRCVTLVNLSSAAPPTRCVGESGVTSFGFSPSSFSSSFISLSYVASLISGLSSV
jgi:hypothetical protein